MCVRNVSQNAIVILINKYVHEYTFLNHVFSQHLTNLLPMFLRFLTIIKTAKWNGIKLKRRGEKGKLGVQKSAERIGIHLQPNYENISRILKNIILAIITVHSPRWIK